MEVLVFVFMCILCAQGRLVPFTPCPNLFNYFESETKEIFGAMTFKNDLSGDYRLVVNMSIATTTDKNLRIYRRTPDYKIQNGESIEYYVLFPFNHTFPLLTSVEFNDKLYCVGPPEKESSEHGVTALSQSNHLKTRLVSGLQPTTPTPPKQPVKQKIPEKFLTNCGEILQPYVEHLVFNGEPTRSGEFPWLVHLRYFNEKKDTYDFRCAGSLVSPTFVVTAAHCVKTNGHLLSKENFIVVLGKHNIKAWAAKSVLRDVVGIHVHPDYVEPSDADIAILELDSPVRFTRTIKAICLWGDDDDLTLVVNQKGTVVGWGRDEKGNEVVEEPKKLEMPVVGQEKCLRQDERFLRLSSNRTFCAGNLDGSGPCTGDSGGCFMMKRGDKWALRGIVSSALVDGETRTCDAHKYMVFADVPKYGDWVLEIINRS